MKKYLLPAIKIFVILTIITGLIYPLTITVLGNVLFPEKSKGSFITKNNTIIGSELIGQQFSKPEYFWGRPSAIANNPMPSGGSNMNPVGTSMKEQIQARIDTIRKYHGNIELNKIPKDLLFASGSGVEPHISPEAAYFQVERIVKTRHFNSEQKEKLNYLIKKSIESPDFLIFGEERVNVLLLNLSLNNL